MDTEGISKVVNPITEHIEKPFKPKVPKQLKLKTQELTKTTPTSSAVVDETKPSLDEKFEKAVKFLEDYSIPWFLKSSDIYIATKKAVTGITVDDKTKAFIENFTNYLKDSTMSLLKAARPMLTEDDVKHLITQIDDLLLRYFTFMDACVDQTKLNIAHMLRAFKNAILQHSEKFKIIVSKQVDNAKTISGQVMTAVNTNVDRGVVYVKDNYPSIHDTGKTSLEIVNKTKLFLIAQAEAYFKLAHAWLQSSTDMARLTYQKSVDGSVVVTQSVLQTAKPYVQTCVSLTQPLFTQAAEVCTHAPVKGYLDPLVVRAVTVKEALEKNPVAGPYVQVGKKAYETVKTYCTDDASKASTTIATN